MRETDGRDEARRPSGSSTDGMDINPNQQDLPEQPAERLEVREDSVPNVWWSDWANNELRLQQLRPRDLSGSLQQSPHHETLESGGVSAAGGLEIPESQGLHGESMASSQDDMTRSNIATAAAEMIRQTSVGHYQLDLAEDFLLGHAGMHQQEPEYFNIGSQQSTPEGNGRLQGHDETGDCIDATAD